MEGNFRITQLSDNEFIIEKEIIKEVKHPWYTFKKPETLGKWRMVNRNGSVIGLCFLINEKNTYKYTTLAEAKDRLNKIRKYPIYYTT